MAFSVKVKLRGWGLSSLAMLFSSDYLEEG